MTKSDNMPKLGINTRLAHSGNKPLDFFGFVNPPVVHASTVLFPDAATMASRAQKYTYGTRGTPTTDALAKRSTNSKARPAPSSCRRASRRSPSRCSPFLSAGDHCLIVDSVYGPTRNFADTMLKRLGVEVEYYDPHVGAGIAKLMKPNTKVVLTEAPGLATLRNAGHSGDRQGRA